MMRESETLPYLSCLLMTCEIHDKIFTLLLHKCVLLLTWSYSDIYFIEQCLNISISIFQPKNKSNTILIAVQKICYVLVKCS